MCALGGGEIVLWVEVQLFLVDYVGVMCFCDCYCVVVVVGIDYQFFGGEWY